MSTSYAISDEEIEICNYLQFLISRPDEAENATPFLSFYKKSIISPHAPSYSLSAHNKTLYVCLDCLSCVESFLAVKPCVRICKNATSDFGATNSQAVLHAQSLPFTLFLRTLSLIGGSIIVFTGQGWSGVVAHVACMLCRWHLASTTRNPSTLTKCISFSGPLLGNSILRDSLLQQQASSLHLTVHDVSSGVDRVVLNYQCISAYVDTRTLPIEKNTWRSIFDPMYVCMNAYIMSLKCTHKGAVRTAHTSPDITPPPAPDTFPWTISPTHWKDFISAERMLHTLLNGDHTDPITAPWGVVGASLFLNHIDDIEDGDCNTTVLNPLSNPPSLPSPPTFPLLHIHQLEHCSATSGIISYYEHSIPLTKFVDHLDLSTVGLPTSHTYPPPPLHPTPPTLSTPPRPIRLDLSAHVLSATARIWPHDGPDKWPHLQFIIEGTHIDTVIHRHTVSQTLLLTDDVTNHMRGVLPFSILSGKFLVEPQASVLLTRVQLQENGRDIVSILVRGLVIQEEVVMCLHTDFGSSNEFVVTPPSPADLTTPPDISRGSVTLHPTMNPSLLLCALLRVAICYKASQPPLHGGREGYTSNQEVDLSFSLFQDRHGNIFQVWKLLLDIERSLYCHENMQWSVPVHDYERDLLLLEKTMRFYVQGTMDLAVFCTTCYDRLQSMSTLVTTLDADESVVRYGVRTLLGR